MDYKYKKSLVASEDGYMITHYERADSVCNKLVITFGDVRSSKRESGFGTDFLKKYGFDTIYVSQKKWTFYQELSIEQFEKYIKPLCENKEVFTYGASLGGYAAIYYAGVVNARAIAFSPRLSLHPIAKEYKTKYSAHNTPFLHIDMQNNIPNDIKQKEVIPVSKQNPFIIYDENDSFDKLFLVNVINDLYPDAQVYNANYGGHLVIGAFKRLGILKEFLLQIINNNTLPEEIEFDVTKDVRYQQMLAFNFAKNKEYDKANELLKEVFQKGDYTTKATAALRRLVMARASEIYPNKNLLSKTIKERLINNHIAKITQAVTEEEALLHEIYFHESLFEFDMALSITSTGVKKYGSEKFIKKEKTLKKVLKFVKNIELTIPDSKSGV